MFASVELGLIFQFMKLLFCRMGSIDCK